MDSYLIILFFFELYNLLFISSFCSEMQFSLERSLKQIRQAIKLITSASFDDFCSEIKPICQRLMYLLKYTCFKRDNWLKERPLLIESIKGVIVLLKSTQYEKYGHFFPYLGLTILRYQKNIVGEAVAVQNQKLVERIVKNEQCLRYNSYKAWSISWKDIELASSPKLQNILHRIQTNQYQIENPKCIGCSKIFINKQSIQNDNECFKNIIGITIQQSENKQYLKKYINSVCNMGGGVILIGVKNSRDVLVCSGIRVRNFQEIQMKVKILEDVVRTMVPSCYWSVDKVVVRASLARPEPQYGIYKLICLRLLIFPANISKLTYLISKKQDKQVLQLYQLNEYKQPIQLIPHCLNLNPTSTFYDKIHKKYRTLKYLQNSHLYISCYLPIKDANIIKELKDNELEKIKLYQEEQGEVIKGPELFFLYSKTSLIIVPLKCNNRQVRIFSKKLIERNIQCDLRMPYDGQFMDEEMRQIWMLSHKIDIVQLKKILRIEESLGSVKEGVIKIMPVFKFLQVESARLTEEKQKIFKNKFMRRFQRGYIEEPGFTTGKNQQSEAVLYLMFEDYNQSIYAYMVLQQLQIRPYFVKQGSSYKKKPK